MILKLRRHCYYITSKDLFMDNGSCVQLTTQSEEKMIWGHRANPVLTKKAIKEIGAYRHIQVGHQSRGVKVFSLELGDE